MKINKPVVYILSALVFISMIYIISAGVDIFHPLYFFKEISTDSLLRTVFIHLRLPRILTAIFIGGALSVSGTIFQSLLRNPLADPYTTGISGGAALGATISIFFNAGNIFTAIAAFCGSIFIIACIYLLQRKLGIFSNIIILSGVAISFICSSGVMFIYAISDSQKIHKAMLWLSGDLSIARYEVLPPCAILITLLTLFTIFYSKPLDIIMLGDSYTYSLGVNKVIIRNLFFTAAILSALSVFLGGVIGFVGLMIPHIIKKLFSTIHLKVILFSFFAGAIFLAFCDSVGSIIAAPFELPSGIITGLIGGIFFLTLVIKEILWKKY